MLMVKFFIYRNTKPKIDDWFYFSGTIGLTEPYPSLISSEYSFLKAHKIAQKNGDADTQTAIQKL